MSHRTVFTNDYSVTAHPRVLAELAGLGDARIPGYGLDPICDEAEGLIRAACEAPSAAVRFLVGGTQVNDLAIDSFLRPWQAVVCATTGHIATHEAGTIENSGHPILALPSHDGLIDPSELETLLVEWRDGGMREHVSEPGLVYVSQPTELGTLYSLGRLEALSRVCRAHGIGLYVDGARMGYGLGSASNDVRLPDLARLTDAFTIGGTKCGALFGEALVIPDGSGVSHMRTLMKIHGGLLAKGWLLGAQFRALFADSLYLEITRAATERAQRVRRAFRAAGFDMLVDSPTNQIFPIVPAALWEDLRERFALMEWERMPDERVCGRVVVSWASTDEDVAEILGWIEGHRLTA